MSEKYWDRAWSLVDGCTPCSPGCEHCWAAAMEDRFRKNKLTDLITGKFFGAIMAHPERLSIPLKRKKPTVYAVWNDLFHEAVPFEFWVDAYKAMAFSANHTFLVLTKRPRRMLEWYATCPCPLPSIYHGLTVCNQQEADEKIPVFLQVPGKKFLSIEPMLGAVDLAKKYGAACGKWRHAVDMIDAVILGGETGPGARPMHPDWVRSVRDQCQSVGVPFFFKSFGKYPPFGNYRLLDGRFHDDLPWADDPGDFEDYPTDEQKEYFKRGGR